MTNWTQIAAYIDPMPLLKRAQIGRRPVDLARELFIQTQRALRDSGSQPQAENGEAG